MSTPLRSKTYQAPAHWRKHRRLTNPTKARSVLLCWIMEVESRRANCHHASIHDSKLARCDEANMDPTGEETLCAQLDEARLCCDATQASEHRSLTPRTFPH